MYERKFLVEHVASDGITHNWRSATISSSTSSSSKWYDASSENFKYGFYFVSMAFVCFQCFSLFCWARAVAATRKMRKHKAHFIFMLFAFLRWMDDKIAHTKTENKQTDFCAKFLWFVFVIFFFFIMFAVSLSVSQSLCVYLSISGVGHVVALFILLPCKHWRLPKCQCRQRALRESIRQRSHTPYALYAHTVRCFRANIDYMWWGRPMPVGQPMISMTSGSIQHNVHRIAYI